MKIYHESEYNMLIKQNALFSEFVETIDTRFVYKDKRYKKFLEKCIARNVDPVSEEEFFYQWEQARLRNRDMKKQGAFELSSFIQILIFDLQREVV